MNQAMKKAKETFAQGNYTCVWCRDNELLTSKEAGLRPLLTRIREGKDLNGFYAADKIVGRAAAFLYVKLGAAGVYAPVMLSLIHIFGSPQQMTGTPMSLILVMILPQCLQR